MALTKRTLLVLGIATACGITESAIAAVTYKDGDSYVKFSGAFQMQYASTAKDNAETTDELYLRRLIPSIEGSVQKDWLGKTSFDLGKANGDNEILIKDAFFQYKGFGEKDDNVRLTIGQQDVPFSREMMTSATAQTQVERTLAGDQNYGSPEKSLGILFSQMPEKGKLHYSAGLFSQIIKSDTSGAKLQLLSPVNKEALPADKVSLMNEGILAVGRVDYYPLGSFKFSQGDFSGKQKIGLGASIYSWTTDADANEKVGAVDKVNALELSAAYRNLGFAIDAQYNLFNADTVDETFTKGMYKDGSSGLTNYAIEGGYMIMPGQLELAVSYDAQDADGYATTWTRTALGANWYFREHDVKIQTTYRMGENADGKEDDADVNEILVQGQYLF